MNQAALHPMPRFGAVVREQLRAVGAGLRRELLVGAALVLLLSALVLASAKGPVTLSPDGAGFVVSLIGLLAPLAVWKGEGPSNRGYLWSLPVARDRHTLVKVFSGWVWLMIGLGAFLGCVALQVWVTGGTPGVDEMRFVFADGVRAFFENAEANPAALSEVHWTTPAWEWVVPFLAPTVMYLIGSAAALVADHPWRWLAAPIIAFALMNAAAGGNIPFIAEISEQIVVGRYSIETLFTGSNEATTSFKLPTGENVLVWRNLAEARQWFTALLIWGVPALAAMLLAAKYHHDR